MVQDLSAGGYLASVATLARPSDMVLSIVKAAIFGIICAIVASHKGLGAKRPVGSQRRRHLAVVTNFVLLFAANFVISQAQATLFPGGVA